MLYYKYLRFIVTTKLSIRLEYIKVCRAFLTKFSVKKKLQFKQINK